MMISIVTSDRQKNNNVCNYFDKYHNSIDYIKTTVFIDSSFDGLSGNHTTRFTLKVK